MTYEITEIKAGSAEAVNLIKLFTKTFSDSEGEEEGALIGQLVQNFIEQTEADDICICNAKENASFIGSAIFSRFECADATRAFLMAPVAVHSAYQGKGIGQKMIHYGLSSLKERGVKLALTYGDIKFYSKTGFRPISEDLVPSPLTLSYPEAWLGQSLDGGEIQKVIGPTQCVKAIENPVYW